MNLEDELEKFTIEVYQQTQKTQPIAFEKIMKHEDRCMDEAGDNVDAYVTCMRKVTKQAEFHEHMVAYKNEHAMKKAVECFHENSKANKGIEPCKQAALSQIARYIKDFSNSF